MYLENVFFTKYVTCILSHITSHYPYSAICQTTLYIHSKNKQISGIKHSVPGKCIFLDSMCYLHFVSHNISIPPLYIHSNHTLHTLHPFKNEQIPGLKLGVPGNVFLTVCVTCILSHTTIHFNHTL